MSREEKPIYKTGYCYKCGGEQWVTDYEEGYLCYNCKEYPELLEKVEENERH